VVGGGSNGLVAAGYLARTGLRTVLGERRSAVGWAAVSEQPFGTGYTVTSLRAPVDGHADRVIARGYSVTKSINRSTAPSSGVSRSA
jgi:hypothetical protein